MGWMEDISDTRESQSNSYSILPSDQTIKVGITIETILEKFPGIRIAKNAAIPYVPWSMIDRINSDGVIAYAESAELLSLLLTLNVPVVNVTMHTEPSHAIPTVHSDNRQIQTLKS